MRYLAKDTFLPRAFIYASNEDVLILQSAVSETKITLINSYGSNQLDPIFHLSASNDLFKIIQTSNDIATFYYRDNTGYLSVDGTTIAKDLRLTDEKNRQLLFHDIGTNDEFAGIGFTSKNMTFQVPTVTDGYLFQAADGAANIPLVKINYDPFTQQTHFGIGNLYPTRTLDVYGDIYTTGTIVTSNLRVIGQSTILDTVTSNTEQISVTNQGTGPALFVRQTGTNSIAEFYDEGDIVLLVDDDRRVGINTMYTRNDFDVNGSAIISGNLGIGGTLLPCKPLDIVGDIQYSGNLYKNGELVITSTFTSWIVDASSNSYNIIGNVGIGTTVMPELLTIYNGNILTNQKYISTYTDEAPFSLQSTYLNSNLNVQYLNYEDSSYYRNVENMNDGVLPTYRGGSGSNYQTLSKILVGGGNSNAFISPEELHWDVTNKYLGINQNAPQERVHVDGNLLIQSSNNTIIYQTSFGNQKGIYHALENKESSGYLGLDTHLKLWSYSNTSAIILGTTNTERIRIQPDGNVGIGTTFPLTKFHVVGNQSLLGNLGIGTMIAPISLYINSTDAIMIPKGTLVQRPTPETGYVRYNTTCNEFEGYAQNQWISLSKLRSVIGDTYILPEYTPGENDKSLHFFTSNVETFTIGSNLKVGIGISRPPIGFYVNTNDAIALPKGSTLERPSGELGYMRYNNELNQFEGFGFGNQWGSLSKLQSVNGDTYILPEYNPGSDEKTIHFYTSNLERMTLDRNGNLGIGSTNPQVKLVIIGTDAIQIPKGTTSDRPGNPGKGYLRFNTTIDKFEGYGESNTWGSVGGVRSVNGDTFITAESIPGADDKTLRLYTNNVERVLINSIGNVGIGTTVARNKLDVTSGNASFTGNIGIGTILPRYPLDIPTGNIYIGGNIGIGTTIARYPVDVYGGIQVGIGTTSDGATLINFNMERSWKFVVNGTVGNTSLVLQCANSAKYFNIQDNLATNFASFYSRGTSEDPSSNNAWFSSACVGYTYSALRAPTNGLGIQGNVGIGTRFPRQALDITGNGGNALIATSVGIGTSIPQGTLYIGGSIPTVVMGGGTNGNLINISDNSYLRFGSDQVYKTHIFVAGETYGGGDQGKINIRYKNYTTFDTVNGVSGTGTEKVRIDNIGNVGIGTTLVRQTFDVEGGNAIISGNVGIGTTIPLQKLDVNGTQSIRGNLGIGTTMVNSPLDLWVNTTTDGIVDGIRLTTSTCNITYNLVTGSAVTMNIIKPLGLLPLTTLAKISYGSKYATYGSGTENNGVLFFDTADNGTLGTKMTITGDGLVGIGTTLPRKKLDVTGGDAIISGNIGIGTVIPLHSLHVEGITYMRGNLGIGTLTPLQNLHVEGKAYVSGNIGIGSTTPTYTLDVNGTCHINNGSKIVVQGGQDGGSTRGIFMWVNDDPNWGIYMASSGVAKSLNNQTACSGGGFTSNAIRIRTAAVETQGLIYETSDEVCNFSIRSSDALTYIRGNVGIGTTAPRAALDTNNGVGLFGNIGIGTTVPLQSLDVRGYTISSRVGINTLIPTKELHVEGDTILNGNVGISTNSPIYPFHVYSTDHIIVSQNGKLAISKNISTAPTSELDIVTTAGSMSNCGILLRNSVNTTPTPSLRILANRYDGDLNTAYAANIGLARYNTNYYQITQSPLGAIHFGGNHTNGSINNVAYMASIQGIADGDFLTSNSAPTSLAFYTGSNSYVFTDTSVSTKGNETMRITYDGKVGIQTSTPQYTLDVRGSSIITGNVGIGTTITQVGLTVYSDTYLGSGMKGVYNTLGGGPFYKQKTWGAEGTTHTISSPDYCVAENSSGTLHIQVKSVTNNKLGNVSLSFLNAYGSDVDTFSIYYHKTDNLTTFSLTVSGNDIVVTTDSDCSMCWSSIGAC